MAKPTGTRRTPLERIAARSGLLALLVVMWACSVEDASRSWGGFLTGAIAFLLWYVSYDLLEGYRWQRDTYRATAVSLLRIADDLARDAGYGQRADEWDWVPAPLLAEAFPKGREEAVR